MKKRSERKKLCIRICLTVIAVVTALIFIMPIVLTISNSFMSAAEITFQLWFHFPENGYRGQAVHLSDGKPQIYTGYGNFLTVCDRVI